MLILYNAILLPLRVVGAVAAAWYARQPGRAEEWDERTARRLPEPVPGCCWIHGASLGEARLVQSMAAALRAARPDLGIAVSAYTPSGRGALPSPPAVDRAFHIPIDFRGLPGRVLDSLRPAALVLMETELWPNLLHEASQRGIPVVVINGRLSPSRMKRYRRLAPLYRPLLRRLEHVGAQSRADTERFLRLGVEAVNVTRTGNLKYDLPVPEVDADALRRSLGLESRRPIVVAGSTGRGEEPLVLDAFEQLRTAHPDVLLILAPRHTERSDEVEEQIVQRGLSVVRMSSGPECTCAVSDVLLVDTVGQLARLYSLAAGAFVGGSLVAVGGHNVLEPAAVGAPVLFGPHTEHFREPAETLLHAGAAIRVNDPPALAAAWQRLLDRPDFREELVRRADDVLSRNRGALDRSVKIVLRTLDRFRRNL